MKKGNILQVMYANWQNIQIADIKLNFNIVKESEFQSILPISYMKEVIRQRFLPF